MEPPKKVMKYGPEESQDSVEPQTSHLDLELPPEFQPTGLSYKQSDGKTILIFTGVDQILTFLLGELKSVVGISGKIEYLKKNLIDTESSVVKIVHTKLRTYCLHKNGTLSLFVSYKQIKKVKNCIGCRDIIHFKDGIACLIKKPGENLIIEHIPDTTTSQTVSIIDCGACVDTDRVSLKSIEVNANTGPFLDSFLGCKVTSGQAMLMFSVGNNVFYVDNLGDNDDTDIRSVRSYSSKVTTFWITTEFPMFVSVLVSGVMEVSYLCPLLKLITHKRFSLFEKCWTFTCGKPFIFSDGQSVDIVRPKHVKKGVEMDRESIKLPGVVGVVYVEELSQVFCVTENRFSYQTSVNFDKKPEKEELKLLLFNDHLLNKTKHLQRQFQELIEQQRVWQKCIDETQMKHQLLEVCLSKRCSDIFCAETYVDKIPRDLSPYKCADVPRLDQDVVCVLIELKNESLKLFHWIEDSFILFEYKEDGQTIKRIIPVKHVDPIKVLFMIRQSHHLHLPDIQVSIVHFIQKNEECLMLQTKVICEKPGFDQYLTISNEIPDKITTIPFTTNHIEQMLLSQDFIRHENERTSLKSSPELISYRIRIPNGLDLRAILSDLGLTTTTRKMVTLFKRHAIIELKEDDASHILTVSSHDVGVVKCLKIMILKRISGNGWKLGSSFLNSLKAVSFSLLNPKCHFTDVIDRYRKIRDSPLDFIKI